MSLSGEICLTSDREITSEALVYKCLGSFDPIDKGERIRWKPIARCRVTGEVIEQKSADGIVANLGGVEPADISGDETFVERMQTQMEVDGGNMTVPLKQRRPPAPSLYGISSAHQERNAAIISAYQTGAYGYREIAARCGL